MYIYIKNYIVTSGNVIADIKNSYPENEKKLKRLCHTRDSKNVYVCVCVRERESVCVCV